MQAENVANWNLKNLGAVLFLTALALVAVVSVGRSVAWSVMPTAGSEGLFAGLRTRWESAEKRIAETWLRLCACARVCGCGFLAGAVIMSAALADWGRKEAQVLEATEAGLGSGSLRTGASQSEVFSVIGTLTAYRRSANSLSMVLKTKEYGSLLVYLEEEEKLLPIGAGVFAQGELSPYEPPGNPGQFDQKAYYRSLGITAALFAEQIRLEGESYSPLGQLLFTIREKGCEILQDICEPGDAGIYQAVLFGEKSSLDGTIKSMYQDNGIAHLLAISGLHLSLIGLGLYKALRKFGLRHRFAGVAAGVVILCYGWMTGGSGSAIRAVLMLLTLFFAMDLGRSYDLLSALSLSAVLTAGSCPFLLTQSGFWLSFGAVFAIGAVSPAIAQALELGSFKGQAVAGGFAVTLVTAPILLWTQYQFPLYSFLLNLIVVPLMAYVLGSGLLGLGLGTLYTAGMAVSLLRTAADGMAVRALRTAAAFSVGSGHYILKFYELLCRTVERLPGHLVITGRPTVAGMWLYYLLLFGLIWQLRKRGAASVWLRRGLFLLGVALCAQLLTLHPRSGCQMTFLDVGQGDGIVLRTKTSAVLVDGGSTSEKKLGENRLEPYLKYEGIRKLDAAIVSHGDEDHISGLRYLLQEVEEIEIGMLILPALGKDDEGYDGLLTAAQNRKVPVHYMEQGEQVELGKLTLFCLYPSKEQHIDRSDRNQQSLILRVDYGQFHALLTGDADKEGEENMVEQDSAYEEDDRVALADIQVLKAAHHGSKYSASALLLEAVSPNVVILSYGSGNRYGHPHQETLELLRERNIPFLETAKQGAVLLYTDGGQLKIRTWKQKEWRKQA